MKDIILIGGGTHCKSVIDSLKLINEWNIIGILDIKEKIGSYVYGIKVIGEDNELYYYKKQGLKYAFITVGGIGDNSLRKSLYFKVKKIGLSLPTIIDPTAIISPTAEIGEGTFVGKGVIVNTDTLVGVNCIINTGVIIDHDGKIGNHVHIAPGSTLSGGVIIGEGSHIGTNSTIIQNINIGKDTLIGAGSVVVKDIGDNRKAFGNPCRVV